MRIFHGVLLLMMVLCVGCGSSLLNGKGRVRFSDGEPVQSGSIEFRSQADASRYASRIDSQGRFNLLNQDGDRGIKPGTYDVVVVQVVLTEDLALDQHSHGRTVPRRYADYYTSGLRASVAPESSELIEVILEPDDTSSSAGK